jgi:hypothetical protein
MTELVEILEILVIYNTRAPSNGATSSCEIFIKKQNTTFGIVPYGTVVPDLVRRVPVPYITVSCIFFSTTVETYRKITSNALEPIVLHIPKLMKAQSKIQSLYEFIFTTHR